MKCMLSCQIQSSSSLLSSNVVDGVGDGDLLPKEEFSFESSVVEGQSMQSVLFGGHLS